MPKKTSSYFEEFSSQKPKNIDLKPRKEVLRPERDIELNLKKRSSGEQKESKAGRVCEVDQVVSISIV